MKDRDRTDAAALHIAYQNLIRLGWKFSAEDVGKSARAMLDAFDGYTSQAQPTPSKQEKM